MMHNDVETMVEAKIRAHYRPTTLQVGSELTVDSMHHMVFYLEAAAKEH